MTAHEDAQGIRNAIKGLGTDDAKLVSIITKRTNEQLQAVANDYLSSFGKSIFDDIKGDTSGDYRELLIALVESRPNFIARTIHNAVKGLGTDESAIIDVLAHTPNVQIKAASDAYHKLYNKNIIEDVSSDASGDFKRLLVGLLAGNRDESTTVNAALAQSDADELYKKGEGKVGTDEDAFITIFLQRSYAHLQEVNRIYKEKKGHDLVAAINSEFSGNLRRTLKALATPRNDYWAARIYIALAGLGTDGSALIRTFVLNDRAQLKQVEEAYKARHEKKKAGVKKDKAPEGKKDPPKEKKAAAKKPITGTLENDIKGDTSGWFEKSLLSLLQ